MTNQIYNRKNKTILIVTIIFAVLGIVYFVSLRDTAIKPTDLTGLTETEKPVTDESTEQLDLKETIEAEESTELIEPEEPITDESEETITETETINGLVQCLSDAGMVIYGSRTCPYCNQLVESLGGYETAGLIYVECSQERERCSQEMQTNYVPEIQINGVLYSGSRDPEALAETTGYQL